MAAAHFFNLSVSTTCRYDDAATQLRVTFHPPASLYQPRRLWHITQSECLPGHRLQYELRESRMTPPDCTTVALRWFLLQSRTPLCSSEDSRYALDSSQHTDYDCEAYKCPRIPWGDARLEMEMMPALSTHRNKGCIKMGVEAGSTIYSCFEPIADSVTRWVI